MSDYKIDRKETELTGIIGREKMDMLAEVVGVERWENYRDIYNRAQNLEDMDYPVQVDFELNGSCNLRCPMCFQVDKTFTDGHPMGLMRMELFKKIIDQAAEGGTGAISIGSRGEPFLNRNLSEMIKYASDKGAFYDLKINTNATVLPERACHALLSSKMNVITLSIDAHEKELYESIRVNAKFEKVLANVKRLNKIRQEYYPSSRAEIRISGVHISEKQDEKAFRKFWNNYCDTIVNY